MNTPIIPGFSDNARAFLFASTRPATQEEASSALHHLKVFFATLRNHGAPTNLQAEWHFGQSVLVVASEDPQGDLGGCTKDQIWRKVVELERALGFALVSSPVFRFIEDGVVKSLNQIQFENHVREGRLTPETPMFSIDTPTLGEVRRGAWVKPLQESWFKDVYERALTPAAAR